MLSIACKKKLRYRRYWPFFFLRWRALCLAVTIVAWQRNDDNVSVDLTQRRSYHRAKRDPREVGVIWIALRLKGLANKRWTTNDEAVSRLSIFRARFFVFVTFYRASVSKSAREKWQNKRKLFCPGFRAKLGSPVLRPRDLFPHLATSLRAPTIVRWRCRRSAVQPHWATGRVGSPRDDNAPLTYCVNLVRILFPRTANGECQTNTTAPTTWTWSPKKPSWNS